jgi:hypothetical protein
MIAFAAAVDARRLCRHPLALALLAGLMLVEPHASTAQADSSPFARRPIEARLATQLGNHASGALRERHRRNVDRAATTVVVANCEDNGTGSLRDAAAGAVSGDVIDLSALPCSTITLSSGGIIAAVDDIELVGPGAGALTIDAAYHGRAFYHLGAGTIGLSGLTITHGTYSGGPYYRALGGCVFSMGDIDVSDSVVTGCTLTDAIADNSGAGGAGLLAYGSVTTHDSTVSACDITVSTGETAVGAGIFAGAHVALVRSTVSGNSADAGTGEAAGGGVLAIQNFTMKYSTLRDNSVSGYNAQGGGVYVQEDVYMLASTISANHAALGAGLRMGGSAATNLAEIRNSTISGNVAELAAAGLVSTIPMRLSNSTIAFNTSIALNVSGVYLGWDAELESSVIANNSAGATVRDLGGDSDASITGANNLIGVTFLTVPGDTISADPLLGALADNGGRTKTHALAPASPAIDAGNNVLDLSPDQRGTGFARVVGADADIGAYERDPDFLFASGFDG